MIIKMICSSNVEASFLRNSNKNITPTIMKDEDQNGGSKNAGRKRRMEELMGSTTIARNKHKEAEMRRRNRINAHISTLKSILTTLNPNNPNNPNPIKWNKASLLGETVRVVKELKQAATSEVILIPSEADDVSVSQAQENDASGAGVIKATVCCEDRPNLVVDLVRALNSINTKVVRAEMSTIGGRSKMVVWVVDGQLGTVKRAVNTVVGSRHDSWITSPFQFP